MKVSLNLAQYYSNVDLRAIPREELLKRIGAQLGAIEEITDWAPKFDGAVIVKVVSCEKHPDADKLSVCMVDDGSGQQIQVVCGAPNVRAGMYAVWLKPGTTVPSTRDKDPLVLEARDIRGQMSNGMLASAKELGISDSHDGILEVDPAEVGHEPKPGEPLTNYFGLDDFVIDCENKMFTHRPDCFGNLGVARELAGISGLKFQSPDWYLNSPSFESRVSSLEILVKNDVPELVPRFMAVAMKNVTVKPSPVWLQACLTRVGIKPINNVVDVTNFVMHLTGQPLHAYDADKLRQVASGKEQAISLETRKSRHGDKLKLLGGKEINFVDDQDVLITSGDVPVGLAGVMGGAETEVDEHTKNIVIECATFDMYSIRRTSMRFGLFTDAVTRFNKGQSPQQNDRALAFALEQMHQHAGAEQASEVYDFKESRDSSLESRVVEVEVDFINQRLGSQLTAEEITNLLESVEFRVETRDSKLETRVPFWRMDIEIPEDIVEEVGRLYGYDKLPVTLPKRSSKPTTKNKLVDFKMGLRHILKERGANEVLTYSFVHGDLMRKTGTDPDKWAYHIRNAISPDLQYYRTSLMLSLLSKVHPNIKAQAGDDNNQFAIFEIGKAHVIDQKDNGLPLQMERLALAVTADDKTARAKQSGAAYYLAKKYLDGITGNQAVYLPLEETNYPITAPYQPGRSAIVSVGGEVLGVVGEFNASVRQALKLPEFTAGFEIDIEALYKYLIPNAYQPLPNFPETSQDITLGSSQTHAEAKASLVMALEAAAAEHGYSWHLKSLNIFQPENSEAKKFTFRITLWHPDRTLTTDETNRLIASLQSAAAESVLET